MNVHTANYKSSKAYIIAFISDIKTVMYILPITYFTLTYKKF